MRIYVAGSGSEVERVRRVMNALRAAGHEISYDWTIDVEAAGAAGHTSDATVEDEHANACADRDHAGVESADVFLLLRNPNRTTFGAAYETGYARALSKWLAKKQLLFVGSRAPVFLRSWEHYETDEAAVAALGGKL